MLIGSYSFFLILLQRATDLFICNPEEEREKYRDETHFLQQELAASKARENSLEERLLKEVGDSQERYREQLMRISDLEVLIIRNQIDFLGFW